MTKPSRAFTFGDRLPRSASRLPFQALVVACGVAALALHASAQDARLSEAVEKGRAVLREMIDAGQTPGVAVAVASAGRVVWSEGFGYADLEHRVPVSTGTRFGIGSISKTLTMAAAVRLMERGLLDLDAPIERYLEDFPHKGRGVTVRRIAAHQSGISDTFATDHYTTSRHFDSLRAAYDEIKKGAMEYPPGSRTVYGTGVYTIIGRVLEVVTGKDYATLMQDEVFGPSGAPGIVPNDRRAIILGRTGFYAARPGGGFEHGAFFDPSYKLPGAGYLATAEELASFGTALLRPSLLGEAGRREMFRAVPLDDGTVSEFALGLRVGTDPSGRLLYQPGGGIGISAWLFIHRDADLVIALLANVNTAPVGGTTHRRIADAFLAAPAVR